MKLESKAPPEERLRNAERRSLRQHPLLANPTPSLIEQYVETQVRDLEDAKELLKFLAKIVLLKP